MVNEFYPNLSLSNAAPCVTYSLGNWPVLAGLPSQCAFRPGTWPRQPFPTANWSSRHLGIGYAPQAGTYNFAVNSKDGVRLWVDNTLLLNQWFDGGTGTAVTVQATLTQGFHGIRIEHYVGSSGGSVLQFFTDLQGDTQLAPCPLPTGCPFP